MKPPCSVDDCDATSLNRGLCNRHYKRLLRHGDPLAGGVERRRNAVCKIEGCGQIVDGYGWCGKHYKRWKKHGDPLYEGRSLAERFWEKVEVREPDECWPWMGSTNIYGYGHLALGGRKGGTVMAHRLSLQLAGVEIDGWFVLHSCDNPPCVNPAHLRPGTQSENMQECHDKWRHPRKRRLSA